MTDRPTFYVDNRGPLPGNLRIDTDVQWADSMLPAPDPKWTHIDSNGHFHARGDDQTMPTLENRPEHVPCDGSCGTLGGCEGYSESHWHCRICGEECEPGTIPGPHRVKIGETKQWTVEIYGSAPEQGTCTVRVVTKDGTRFGLAVVADVQVSADEVTARLAGTSALTKAG